MPPAILSIVTFLWTCFLCQKVQFLHHPQCRKPIIFRKALQYLLAVSVIADFSWRKTLNIVPYHITRYFSFKNSAQCQLVISFGFSSSAFSSLLPSNNYSIITTMKTQLLAYLLSVKPYFTTGTWSQEFIFIPLKFHNWYWLISATCQLV